MNLPATLIVVGTPLDESAPLSSEAISSLAAATVVIGESRKVTMRYLVQVPGGREKGLFLLDHLRPSDELQMQQSLRELSEKGGTAALISDCGMPILFDPGEEVLKFCLKLGFRVRSAGGQTSWGSACALSGFGTPFLVLGFPPRDNEERRTALGRLKQEPAHCVLMDTPYRFRPLLSQCRELVGKDRGAFLAWEIGKSEERLLWGSLDELEKIAERTGLQKGEFVLILHGAARRQKP